MASEADFSRFCADSGSPLGQIFGTFRHFLGGRNFDRFVIDFRITFWEARRSERGLRKLILSLQTPKNPKDTDLPFITLYTPKGCGEFERFAQSAGPLQQIHFQGHF